MARTRLAWYDPSVAYKDRADQARAARAYYDANKALCVERARTSNRKRLAARRAVIIAAKDRPCADCHVRYPYYVMQFDHRGEKSFTIGRTNSDTNMQALLAEIAKCDVVCANCHAERTQQKVGGGDPS